jgi:hypothetical protein
MPWRDAGFGSLPNFVTFVPFCSIGICPRHDQPSVNQLRFMEAEHQPHRGISSFTLPQTLVSAGRLLPPSSAVNGHPARQPRAHDLHL